MGDRTTAIWYRVHKEAPAATGTLNATRTSNEQMAMDERTTECLSGTMDITIICGHDDVGGKNARVEVTRRAIEMMSGPPGRLLVFSVELECCKSLGATGPLSVYHVSYRRDKRHSVLNRYGFLALLFPR
jgi:hypothetical protein